jgi:hypothetical protein
MPTNNEYAIEILSPRSKCTPVSTLILHYDFPELSRWKKPKNAKGSNAGDRATAFSNFSNLEGGFLASGLASGERLEDDLGELLSRRGLLAYIKLVSCGRCKNLVACATFGLADTWN